MAANTAVSGRLCYSRQDNGGSDWGGSSADGGERSDSKYILTYRTSGIYRFAQIECERGRDRHLQSQGSLG